jgi:hypothetical protein
MRGKFCWTLAIGAAGLVLTASRANAPAGPAKDTGHGAGVFGNITAFRLAPSPRSVIPLAVMRGGSTSRLATIAARLMASSAARSTDFRAMRSISDGR